MGVQVIHESDGKHRTYVETLKTGDFLVCPKCLKAFTDCKDHPAYHNRTNYICPHCGYDGDSIEFNTNYTWHPINKNKTMAKVDNFKLFSDVLLFKEDLRPEIADDVFYMVQIMTRTKDTGEKPKCIRTMFVESREYLMSHKDFIVKLCETFNARAYINVNPSSYKKCVLRSFDNLASMVENESYRGILSLPETMAGEYTNSIGKECKKWIVDLDDLRTEEELSPYITFIMDEYNNSRGKKEVPCEIIVVPTVSGSHLLVTPFDKRGFKNRWPGIDIHENSPSILYYGG